MTVRRTVAAMISPTGTEPAASVASVSAQLGPLGHTSPLLPHDGQPSHGSTPHLTLSPEVGSMSHSSSDSAHDGSRIHFSPLPKQTGPPSHCSALSPQVGSLSHSSNPCQPLSSQTGPPSHCSPLSPQVGSLSHSSNPCQPLSSQTGPLSHSAPESSQTAARAVVASTDIPAHVTAGPYPGDLTFALHTADHCDITAYVTVGWRNGHLVADGSPHLHPQSHPSTLQESQDNSGTWMTSLQPARDRHEQNVEVVVEGGHLVLHVLRHIARGERLLLWYGDGLARAVGVPFLTPANIRGAHHYECSQCGASFQFPNTLKAHLMFTCTVRTTPPSHPWPLARSSAASPALCLTSLPPPPGPSTPSPSALPLPSSKVPLSSPNLPLPSSKVSLSSPSLPLSNPVCVECARPSCPAGRTCCTTGVPATGLPATGLPATATGLPPTDLPPTGLPPTDLPPTDLPPTASGLPPTGLPPTGLPATTVDASPADPSPTTVAGTVDPLRPSNVAKAVDYNVTSPVSSSLCNVTSPVTSSPYNVTSPFSTSLYNVTSPVRTSLYNVTSPVSTNLYNVTSPVSTNLYNVTSPVSTILYNVTSPVSSSPSNVTSSVNPSPSKVADPSPPSAAQSPVHEGRGRGSRSAENGSTAGETGPAHSTRPARAVRSTHSASPAHKATLQASHRRLQASPDTRAMTPDSSTDELPVLNLSLHKPLLSRDEGKKPPTPPQPPGLTQQSHSPNVPQQPSGRPRSSKLLQSHSMASSSMPQQSSSMPQQSSSMPQQSASMSHQSASMPHQSASMPHQSASMPHQSASMPHQSASMPQQSSSSLPPPPCAMSALAMTVCASLHKNPAAGPLLVPGFPAAAPPLHVFNPLSPPTLPTPPLHLFNSTLPLAVDQHTALRLCYPWLAGPASDLCDPLPAQHVPLQLRHSLAVRAPSSSVLFPQLGGPGPDVVLPGGVTPSLLTQGYTASGRKRASGMVTPDLVTSNPSQQRLSNMASGLRSQSCLPCGQDLVAGAEERLAGVLTARCRDLASGAVSHSSGGSAQAAAPRAGFRAHIPALPVPSEKEGEPLDLLPPSFFASKSRKGHLCLYCGKLYSRKYGLKIHLRTHTGYKPLKCKVCLRPFGDPSNLNKHVRLHAEGDTPYRCDYCGKVLVRRRDLERHVRSRHPSVKTEREDDDVSNECMDSEVEVTSDAESSEGSGQQEIEVT